MSSKPRVRFLDHCRTGLCCLALSGPALSSVPVAAEEEPGLRRLICDVLVDDFSSTKPGAFPAEWGPKEDEERALAERTYRVQSVGGRRVLHAQYHSGAVTIGRRLPPGWDPARYPILQWEWSARKLPKGADEASLGSNDCAAAVYAFWEIGFPFYVNSLKYTWSSTLQLGSFVDKAMGHQRVIVRQAGAKPLGKFHTVRVNLVEDYARAFEKEWRLPTGIAVLTDADDTESVAEAYYANFRLCRYGKIK